MWWYKSPSVKHTGIETKLYNKCLKRKGNLKKNIYELKNACMNEVIIHGKNLLIYGKIYYI